MMVTTDKLLIAQNEEKREPFTFLSQSSLWLPVIPSSSSKKVKERLGDTGKEVKRA